MPWPVPRELLPCHNHGFPPVVSFRIVERPDAPIDADAYTDTLISWPYPFKVDFDPRLDVKLLRTMMETEAAE